MEDLQKDDLWGKVTRRFLLLCDQTTMHGMQFLNPEKTPSSAKRMCWLTIMIGTVGAIFIFTHQACKDYVDAKTVMTMEIHDPFSSGKILPEVTICKENRLRLSLIQDVLFGDKNSDEHLIWNILKYAYFGTIDQDDLHEDEVEKIKDIFVKKFILGSEKLRELRGTPEAKEGIIFKKVGLFYPQSPQILSLCQNNQLINQSFVPEFPSDFGFCTRVQIDQSDNDDFIIMVLDAEGFDSSRQDLEPKFRISFNPPGDVALTLIDGLQLNAGGEFSIDVVRTETNVDQDTILAFYNRPEVRGCVADNREEGSLLHHPLPEGSNYTLNNCLMAAAVDKVVEECGCLPDMIPIDPESSSLSYCRGKSLTCSFKHLHHVGQHFHAMSGNPDRSEQKKIPCLQACNSVSFKFFITNMNFINVKHNILCSLLAKINFICSLENGSNFKRNLQDAYPGICQEADHHPEVTRCQDRNPCQPKHLITEMRTKKIRLRGSLRQYVEENLAVVKVRMAANDHLVHRFKMSLKTPTIWFVSTLGGIFGLVCGMSLITFIEIGQAILEIMVIFFDHLRIIRNRPSAIEVANDPKLFRRKLEDDISSNASQHE